MPGLRQVILPLSFYIAMKSYVVRSRRQASVWQRYVQAELASSSDPSGDEAVKGIFGRCLLACPSVELWSAYIR